MRPSHVSTALLAIALLGCADRGRDAATAGEPGGTLLIATPSGAAPKLPLFANEVLTVAVADLVFDKLAEIGDNLNTIGDEGFTPRLAKGWTWAADSLSIAFAIDPAARWHDGQPVRAGDVRFTLAVVKDPKVPTGLRELVSNLDSVSVPDSLTAVVWFGRRTPEQFFDAVYQLHVLPEHVLKDVARERLAEVSGTLVGSGRFRLARVESGVQVELLADTANYRGRAKLDRVVYTRVQDPGAGITQLLSGQADVFENVPASVLPQMDSASPARAVRYPSLQLAYLGFNHRDAARPSVPHPVFSDRRVRRALAMSVDRVAMLRNVFDTLGVLARGPFPNVIADTTVRVPPFDRNAAAMLLDSAGWRAGPDGMRAKNGRPLAFRVMVPTSSAPRMRYALLLQEQFKAIGAQADIESLEFTAFLDRQMNGRFDAALMAFSPDPNIGTARQLWSTSAFGPTGQNVLKYSSPKFDALIDSALATFDAGRARRYLHDAYQTIADDSPAIWLYDVLPVVGVHRRVRTAPMRATGWWSGLADWWIPAGERIERDRIGLRPAQP